MHTLTNPLPGAVKSSPELENLQVVTFLRLGFKSQILSNFVGSTPTKPPELTLRVRCEVLSSNSLAGRIILFCWLHFQS